MYIDLLYYKNDSENVVKILSEILMPHSIECQNFIRYSGRVWSRTIPLNIFRFFVSALCLEERERISSASANLKHLRLTRRPAISRRHVSRLCKVCGARVCKRPRARTQVKKGKRDRTLTLYRARRQEVTGEAERASRISMLSTNKTHTRVVTHDVRFPNKRARKLVRRRDLSLDRRFIIKTRSRNVVAIK